MPPIIVLYGRDSLLLWSRRMILEQAHFEVHTTSDPVELDYLLRSLAVQLLILCHSLPDHEIRMIRQSMAATVPSLAVLTLNACDDRLPLQDDTDSGFYRPQAFLATVQRLAPSDFVHRT